MVLKAEASSATSPPVGAATGGGWPPAATVVAAAANAATGRVIRRARRWPTNETRPRAVRVIAASPQAIRRRHAVSAAAGRRRVSQWRGAAGDPSRGWRRAV